MSMKSLRQLLGLDSALKHINQSDQKQEKSLKF